MRMVALTYPAKRAFIIDAEVTYSFTPKNIRGGSGAYFATNRHGGGLGMVMMYDGHVEKLNMDQAYDSANDPSNRYSILISINRSVRSLRKVFLHPRSPKTRRSPFLLD